MIDKRERETYECVMLLGESTERSYCSEVSLSRKRLEEEEYFDVGKL